MKMLRVCSVFVLSFFSLLLQSCSYFNDHSSGSDKRLTIALLHMAPDLGELDTNRILIESGMRKAKRYGADWVMTPELSLTGYKFSKKIGINWIQAGPDEHVSQLQAVANELDIVLFLSHLEQPEEDGQRYNTLFVIDSDGEIIGRHRKINTIPIAESWSEPGDSPTVINIDDKRVGLLICADAWPQEHSQLLKQKGAELILSSANWPPGKYGPKDTWEKRSFETGLPVIVNNRTGIEADFDTRKAESIVAIQGERVFQYSSERSSIIILRFEKSTMRLIESEVI